VRLSNSQAVSLIQHVLMTLVLRLIMNHGFSFDFSIACTNDFGAATHNEPRFQFRLFNRVFRVLPGFMGKSLVIAVRSSTKRNNKTRSCT